MGFWNWVTNIISEFQESARERRMKNQQDLINSMIDKLKALKDYPLDDVDITELDEAYDIIDMLHDEIQVR